MNPTVEKANSAFFRINDLLGEYVPVEQQSQQRSEDINTVFIFLQQMQSVVMRQEQLLECLENAIIRTEYCDGEKDWLPEAKYLIEQIKGRTK